MSKVVLRRAAARDAAALKAVIDAAYAPWKQALPDLPDVTSGLSGDIAGNIVFVAEVGGRIVGGMILVAAPDHLKLANIAVSPDASGRGIASALLERADAEALARGTSVLRLNTHAEMAGNLAFYARRGWRETGRSGVTVQMERRVGGGAETPP